MVEAGGRLCQLLSLPRSTGQIYGLLFLAPKPISLDDIVELLRISKGSASTGTRQLLKWGAIRQMWVPGDRRDFFEAVPDLGHLIRASYTDFVKPRLTSSGKRLASMNSSLEEEFKQGILTKEEFELCQSRLKGLTKLQRKLSTLAPLAETFI